MDRKHEMEDGMAQLAALQERVVEMRATKMAEAALAKAKATVDDAKDAIKKAQVAEKTLKEVNEGIDGKVTAMVKQMRKLQNTMVRMRESIVQQQRASTAQQQKDAAEIAALLEIVQGVADGAQKSMEVAQGIVRTAEADLQKLRGVSARLLRMKPGKGKEAAGAGAGAAGGAGRGAGAAAGLLSLHGVVRPRLPLESTGAMPFNVRACAFLCVCANCCAHAGGSSAAVEAVGAQGPIPASFNVANARIVTSAPAKPFRGRMVQSASARSSGTGGEEQVAVTEQAQGDATGEGGGDGEAHVGGGIGADNQAEGIGAEGQAEGIGAEGQAEGIGAEGQAEGIGAEGQAEGIGAEGQTEGTAAGEGGAGAGARGKRKSGGGSSDAISRSSSAPSPLGLCLSPLLVGLHPSPNIGYSNLTLLASAASSSHSGTVREEWVPPKFQVGDRVETSIGGSATLYAAIVKECLDARPPYTYKIDFVTYDKANSAKIYHEEDLFLVDLQGMY